MELSKPRPKSKRERTIQEKWVVRQRLSRQFLTQFMDQYISSLREMKKWQKEQPPLELNDLVLLTEPNKKRRDWPMGRISKIIMGRDGLVRSCIIRTAAGTLTRSVHSLLFLRHLDVAESGETEEAAENAAPPDPDGGEEEDTEAA
jgi:hypothetical protein